MFWAVPAVYDMNSSFRADWKIPYSSGKQCKMTHSHSWSHVWWRWGAELTCSNLSSLRWQLTLREAFLWGSGPLAASDNTNGYILVSWQLLGLKLDTELQYSDPGGQLQIICFGKKQKRRHFISQEPVEESWRSHGGLQLHLGQQPCLQRITAVIQLNRILIHVMNF